MKNALAIGMVLVSTMAFADSHNEKKADAMKKEAPAAPAMAAPTAPAELAAMAKSGAGNWKCKGKAVADPSKPDMVEFTGTYKSTLDLEKFWLKGEWTSAMGKMKMRGLIYTTYDASSKKWHRIMLDNAGGSGWESSSGLPAGAAEGKIVWEGESRMGAMTSKTRSTEEVAAKSFKITSEMSMDGGKKYVTGMEMTCTK